MREGIDLGEGIEGGLTLRERGETRRGNNFNTGREEEWEKGEKRGEELRKRYEKEGKHEGRRQRG